MNLKKKYGTFSRIINLGDILERGTHPKQVISRLKSLEKNYPLFSVIGNHDEAFLINTQISGSSIESMDAHAKLNDEDISFFKQNNDGTFGNQEYIDKKNGLFCVHGGPLDPKKIMPKNARNEAWLYQRSWQRLTDEDFEYFSYYGYNYKASSAFDEVTSHMKNHIILCGHQHEEEAIMQDEKIHHIYHTLKPKKEKISGYILENQEIEISPSNNYLIRLGLAGPEGYYGNGTSFPHFAIIQYDPKKVILFSAYHIKGP
jgi:predicted phosphodiesterase